MNDFRFWCHKVLPLVYDDSLSYYETLCKFIGYLNGLGEDVKEVVKEMQDLKDYVDNFIDTLDVETIVETKLNQMLADGDFDEIFAGMKEDIIAYVDAANPANTMQAIYEGDYVLDTTLHSDYYSDSHFTDELWPSAVLHIGQWFLCINGVNSASHNDSYDNFGSYLFCSDQVDTANYANQKNWNREEIGHANSACYDGNKVYIIPLFKYSGSYDSSSRSDWRSVLSFDIDTTGSVPTLTNRSEIAYNLPTAIMGISYDHVKQKKYAYCYGGHIYEFDGVNFTLVKTITAPGLSRYNQDFATHDGIFYLSMPRGVILIGKIDTGEILATKFVARSGLGGLRQFGELEGMEFDSTGKLYAINTYKVAGDSKTSGGWGVIDANVTYIPTKYIDAEPTENLYAAANSTFTVNPTKFKSANTSIKHPVLINMFAHNYPVARVDLSTDYGIHYGVLQFWYECVLILGTTAYISQIDAVRGHVLITNKTSADALIDMSDKNARSASDNSLFIVRNTARLTFALSDPDGDRAELNINITADRGTYGRLNIGFDFPLVAIRTIPAVTFTDSHTTGYLQATAAATDATNGVYDHDGLYVGSHRLAMWAPET